MNNKLKYVTGDLLALMYDGDFDVVAHGCNCFHAMGSGIAKQFAEAYPAVPNADFVNSLYGDRDKLGSYTKVDVVTDSAYVVTVYNAYTQYSTGGRAISYDAIYDFFEKFAEIIPLGHRIGLPQIGAGLGGGLWDIIEIILNETLIKAGHDVTIVIYKP